MKISRPPSAHHPRRGPGPEEGSGEVHVDHLAEDPRRRRERTGHDRGDAGVGNPHVDATPFSDGGIGHRLVELRVADIAAQDQGGSRECGRDGFEVALGPRHQGHLGPGPREGVRDQLAQAP